jgi:hypothetical protein
MALHLTPEDHNADPPEKWIVVKVGEKCWQLDTSLGHALGHYPTRKAAEADKLTGPYVSLFEKEGRWFRGESIAQWKPYVPRATDATESIGAKCGKPDILEQLRASQEHANKIGYNGR